MEEVAFDRTSVRGGRVNLAFEIGHSGVARVLLGSSRRAPKRWTQIQQLRASLLVSLGLQAAYFEQLMSLVLSRERGEIFVTHNALQQTCQPRYLLSTANFTDSIAVLLLCHSGTKSNAWPK